MNIFLKQCFFQMRCIFFFYNLDQTVLTGFGTSTNVTEQDVNWRLISTEWTCDDSTKDVYVNVTFPY